MSDAIDRQRIEKIDWFAVSSMIIQMEGAGFQRKKFSPTSEVSHLEIYQYAKENDKVTLVFDTVAKILTVDAKTAVLETLKQFFPQPKQTPDFKPKEIVVTTKKRKPAASKPIQAAKKPELAQSSSAAALPKAEMQTPQFNECGGAATFSLTKFKRSRLEWCLKAIKDLGGITVQASEEAAADFAEAIYQIKNDTNKVTLQYSKKQTATLQGKECALFDNIKSILLTESDIRQLKKVLPYGLKYLSEPSRIDLTNGMTDLAGGARLSDYSVLLIAPYRALEKLIYDLQQAESINVKMIGQAYEKDENGKYMLKKGYTKRIGSIVYSEVMTALYTEYFATRNFYTHSDNSSESTSRGISNKPDAQNILNNLIGVIEYNCKKLSEINFSLENIKN